MPTPAAASRLITCCAPVPEAATRPTGPGRTTLAKPSPTPPTTAVPQSGPITSSPRSAAACLSRDLLLDRHVVGEDHAPRAPASSASIASTNAYRPGRGDERERRVADRADGRGRGAGGHRVIRRDRCRPRHAGPASSRSSRSSAAGQRLVVVGGDERDDACRSGRRRPAARSPCSASSSRLTAVAIATSARSTPD